MNIKEEARTVLKQMVRDHQQHILKSLTQKFGNASLCEDAFQEALFKALTHWQQEMPQAPRAWLYQTAKNSAIDMLRKHKTQSDKTVLVSLHFEQLLAVDGHQTDDHYLIPDQELKLIFTCCHPALSFENQVALTLQVICGLSAEQIATAFIKNKKTIEQRLVRSKKKIKLAGIPYQLPDKAQLSQRLDAVLKIIYLIFNQGYYSEHNDHLIQERMMNQAIRLGELIVNLIPRHAESMGLLSLMYFHKARMTARGSELFIDLATQDRTLWQQQDIATADRLLEKAVRLKALGPFQIQAAISGVHSQAAAFKDTDWIQIALLYEKLLRFQNDAIILINYAVSLSYGEQAEKALAILNHLADQKETKAYLPFYLARAHAFASLGQTTEAIENYTRATALSKNSTEKNHLINKLNELKNSAP